METLRNRLLENIEIITESGCWIWMKCLSKPGYGRLSFEGKPQLAHRLSFKEFSGAVPDNLCVLHRCDTPACINPNHLFLGTHQDNADDKVKKGRAKSGSDTAKHGDWFPSAKLKESNIPAIRNSTGTLKETAEKYNVSIATIHLIKKRKIWRFVK